MFTVEDAFNCFMFTDLDYLVCGNYILDKKKQIKINLNFFIKLSVVFF